MRRHLSVTTTKLESNNILLPLSVSPTKLRPSSSPKKLSISRSSIAFRIRKKRQKLSNVTINTICNKTYLIVLGLFTLYHVDLFRLALFSRGQSSKESKKVTNPNKEITIRKRQTKSNNYSNTRNVPPLRYPHDYEKFTVRINTWKREEQLKLSIEHYLTCSGVGQIQVVWCIDQGEPPVWLLDMEQEMYELHWNSTGRRRSYLKTTATNNTDTYPRLIIERHIHNTLNERFLEIEPIPTAGVLSVDDDVIRPCLAIHTAFVKWTKNPERQVGFDARTHIIEVVVDKTDDYDSSSSSSSPSTVEKWSYTSLSPTEQSNKYSITLTRYSFQHRYYLQSYMDEMPSSVREFIAENFNCEDIAMSLWISSKTGGKPPLLADYWAIKSYIEIYVTKKISGGTDHKSIRNYCFDTFATLFHLKGRLHATNLRPDDFPKRGKIPHYGFFDYGDIAEDWNRIPKESTLQKETRDIIDRWKKDQDVFEKELKDIKRSASKPIYDQGLLEDSQPFKNRFPNVSTFLTELD